MKSKQPQNPAPILVVTGAAGFIGRRVVARLAAAGKRVLAMDRVEDPCDWPRGVEYRQVDLEQEMPRLPDCWMLVHLAWSMYRGDELAQVMSVAAFARLLGQPGLTRVVGLGSAEEYGELAGILREDMAPGSHLSAYGAAKHRACHALKTWAQNRGLRAAWLRPFVVYGPGQGGNMAIPYAVRQAKAQEPAKFSEGSQRRDFVHADDVAEGIVCAVQWLEGNGATFAVFNLGRGEAVRLRDVLERIAGQTGAEETFHFGTRSMRPNEPREQFADITAAREQLGWRAAISWQQGIDSICAEIPR